MGNRNNLEDANLYNCRQIGRKVSTGFLADTAIVLTSKHGDALVMIPTAARNIDLPADTEEQRGRMFVIFNASAGANTITVRLTGGGATVATIAQNKTGTFFLDHTGVWRGGSSA